MIKKWSSIILAVLILTIPLQTDAFSSQVVERGAFGDDVIELQARLQYIGYYNGAIDGVFGYGTYWALRNFQQDYGLDVDGIAGANTKKALANNSQYNREWVMEQINKGTSFYTLRWSVVRKPSTTRNKK